MLVKRLIDDPDFPTPERGRTGDAGYDIRCAVRGGVRIEPGEQVLVPTGFAWEIHPYFYGQVSPRSGLAYKQNIHTNAGVIDSNYRGEVGVLLENRGNKTQTFRYGDRIAQMVIIRICDIPDVVEVNELTDANRGEDGFGSTGVL